MFGCYLYKTWRFYVQFHLIVVLVLLKTCVGLWRLLQSIARKKDLISMYRGPVVIGL